MYQLDLDGVQRYIDALDEPARKAVDDAVRSTIHFMLGIRDGSCYRYECEIRTGVIEVQRAFIETQHLNNVRRHLANKQQNKQNP